jgi:hypothetical protein
MQIAVSEPILLRDSYELPTLQNRIKILYEMFKIPEEIKVAGNAYTQIDLFEVARNLSVAT